MEILAIAAILFAGLGIYSVSRHMKLKGTDYDIIKGKMIGFKTSYSSSAGEGTSTHYAPIFEYYYQGKTYKAVHSVATSVFGKPSSKFKEGMAVELRVYKDKPDKAVLNTTFGVNSNLIVGIGSIALAVVLLVVFFGVLNGAISL